MPGANTGIRRQVGKVLTAALMGATALLAGGAATSAMAQSAVDAVVTFNIPAQPLGNAIVAFARATGVSIFADGNIDGSIQAGAVSGSVTISQGLSQLLDDTGYTYRANGGGITLVGPAAEGISTDGSIVLGEVNVSARLEGNAVDLPYQTPGSTFFISSEQIDRFKGTNASDILSSAPGVFSGESRSSAGMDVNIRGMQGHGRVAVTVDGAQNGSATYRGYQGISNTTYIDPDFISGIAIQKGPASGAGGVGAIGGTVAMTTISADDIIPAGETFGARLKVEGVGNTTSPWSAPTKLPLRRPGPAGTIYSETDIARPGLLNMESGSGSILLGARTEYLDVVAGFARRYYGNYHAGTNGADTPQPTTCDATSGFPCDLGWNWFTPGLTAYMPGEEVLNTSQDTLSTLLKGTLRLPDNQKLELGYSRFESRYGESFPSGFWNNEQALEQRQTSEVGVSNYTARYTWNPDNDLIDLKWNFWLTDLNEQNQSSTVRVEKWGTMYGTDLSNTSQFDLPVGVLTLNYGLAYRKEATGPVAGSYYDIPVREGERQETSVFTDAKWTPVDWFDLTGGLRWHGYESRNTAAGNTDPTKTGSALDYSAGIAVRPLEGLELFGTYRNAARLPSLFESTGGFMTTLDPNLRPEVAQTWEIGANYVRDGLFTDDDQLRFKASYFNSTVDDYINRRWQRVCTLVAGCTWSWQYTQTMNMSNIDQARFSGIDLSARYAIGGFSAELAGTYYNNVEFCRTEGSCMNSSLAADYATNQIPPKFSASLTLAQKLMEDRLTIGTRISHVGERSAAAEPTAGGANPFIAAVPWTPYTLVDLFLEYKPVDALTFNVSVENLFDIYYVNPMSLALIPSPGRTLKVGVTGELSDGTLSAFDSSHSKSNYDWTGFYAGIHGAAATTKAEASDLAVNGGYGQQYQLHQLGGFGGGAQIGARYQLENNLVVGLEGSISALDIYGSALTYQGRRALSINTNVDWVASARVKAGFASDGFLIYGLAGFTAAQVSGSHSTIIDTGRAVHSGVTLGGGVEVALTDNLSLVGEYSFTPLSGDPLSVSTPDLTWSWQPKLALDEFKVGLNYRF